MSEQAKETRVSAGILFGDLKGSTEEAEANEASTVEKLREYARIVHETTQSLSPDFYKLKTEGDGFMATFTTAHAVVKCGYVIQQEFRRRGWHVRLGGHFGEVYRDKSGDSVGADVNRAARIQSAADATQSQFLVSDVVQSIVRNREPYVHFAHHEPISAKGVGEALVVFEVQPAPDKRTADTKGADASVVEQPQRAHDDEPSNPVLAKPSSTSKWPLRLGVLVVLLLIAMVQVRPIPSTTATRPVSDDRGNGACNAPRPVEGGPTIYVEDQQVRAPGFDVIRISLRAGGQAIAGLQNDIGYNEAVTIQRKPDGKPDCSVNPSIDKGGAFGFQPPGCDVGTCTSIRAIIFAPGNLDPIPDGSSLYTCRVAVKGAGGTLSVTGVVMSDPTGQRTANPSGRDGIICVSG